MKNKSSAASYREIKDYFNVCLFGRSFTVKFDRKQLYNKNKAPSLPTAVDRE